MITLKFNEQQAKDFVAAQHAKYYAHLRAFLNQQGLQLAVLPAMPTIAYEDSVFNTCGHYNPRTNVCTYCLPLAAWIGEDFYATVAHEMVHAFQDTVYHASADHGREFLWLMKECGFAEPKKQIVGNYSVAYMRDAADELKRQRGGTSNTLSFAQRGSKSLRQLLQERNRG